MSIRNGQIAQIPYEPRGLVNGRRGLARLHDTYIGGDGLSLNSIFHGGIDIVGLGDSLMAGMNYGASNTWRRHAFTWWREMTLMLRRLRAPGMGAPGGMGFIRFDTAGGSAVATTSIGLTVTGTVTASPGFDGTSGYTLRIPSAASKANRVHIAFNGATQYGGFNMAASELEMVHATYASGNDCLVDINASTAAGTGSGGIVSETVAGASGSSVFGIRRLYSLDPSVVNVFQAAGAASGSNPFFFDGLIHYNGDYAQGIRTHNLATPGLDSNGFTTNTNRRDVNILPFTTNTLGGATRAKCFVIGLGVNDMGAGNSGAGYAQTRTVAQYEASLRDLITRITSQPSAPCVLLLNYIPPKFTQIWDRTTNRPQEYLDVMYRMTRDYPDTVALLDVPNAWGIPYDRNAYTTAFETPSALAQEDDVHTPTSRHEPLAKLVAEALAGSPIPGA